jgi:regulator of replication initiation timing
MFITTRRPHLLHNADNGGGTGGQQQGDDRQNLQGLLQRHNNDAMQVIATLLAENHGLRDERRQLRSQLPAQGATVLTSEQAQQWTAYQQLGALDALKQQLEQAQTAGGELATLRRQQLLGQVQEASGFKASVLDRLPGADKLTFELRDSQVDGKAVKAVVVKDAEGKEHPLTEYAKQQWADFLPALQVQTQAPPAPTGTPFPAQNPGTGGPPKTVLESSIADFQKAREAGVNPLAPKTQA